jgi:hypothetical protein
MHTHSRLALSCVYRPMSCCCGPYIADVELNQARLCLHGVYRRRCGPAAMRITVLLFSLSLLSASSQLAAAFYEAGSGVQSLTPSIFDSTLTQDSGVLWAVEFYAPW